MGVGQAPVNPESFELSVEEFDAMDGYHEFSDKYKKEKREMLRDYKRNHSGHKRNYARAAAAAVAVVVTIPTAAYAASSAGLFNRLWGNGATSTIESHSETVYSDGKDKDFVATFPRREYVPVDEKEAEALIGEHVSYEKVTRQVGDNTITFLDVVTDGNGAVAEFTIENPNGVNALGYDQSTNESKGADFTDESEFNIYFENCAEKIYVDLERSTEETLYCYDYMTMKEGAIKDGIITVELTRYPGTFGEWIASEDQESEKECVQLHVDSVVGMEAFTSDKGGSLQISPISMKLLYEGLDFGECEVGDPYAIYQIIITDKDGGEYLVFENENDVHPCEVETDNTGYVSGYDDCMRLLFNRLVNVDNIASVTVNGETYTR